MSDAFDGLLSQTYRNFEVCIYNDGSKDRTAEIVDNYARKFAAKGIQCYHSSGKESKGNRFKLCPFHSVGVGYSKAAAVRLATSNSRFLCFNDADDVSLPNRLELQLAACLNSFNPDNCFVGSKFTRLPENSTERYSNWACSLTDEQLYNQVPLKESHHHFCYNRYTRSSGLLWLHPFGSYLSVFIGEPVPSSKMFRQVIQRICEFI